MEGGDGMFDRSRIKIDEIISVNHLVGNPKGSHTEFKTEKMFYYQILFKLKGEAVITFGDKTISECADYVRFLPSRADFDFDILSGSFADEKIIFFLDIVDDCFIEVIARNLCRVCGNYFAERNNSNLRSAAADINNHTAFGSFQVSACADCCGKRFFHQASLTGACGCYHIEYGAAFKVGDA